MEMVVVVEEEMEKPWKKIVNEKKKKSWSRFRVNNSIRPEWDALPSLALLNIFRNLNFKDRFKSIPLVCKSWNSVISNDPRCWSSMIPDYISPDDDAFIKEPDYQVDPPSKFCDRWGCEVVRDSGVTHLRNLIKKSSSSDSGSSSTITSLCLDPFHFSNPKLESNDSLHQDEVLHLIANCCPNLKHISFEGFYCASIETVLEIFQKCNKIKLIDFSDSPYADSEQVIEELGKCLPNLRGIRMEGWKNNYSIHDAIATHLPRIKLLAVDFRNTYDEDFQKLTSESECCLYELQYLSVGLWIINQPPVCTHIPEFHYEKLLGYECEYSSYEEGFQPLRSVHRPKVRPRLTRYTQVCYTCLAMKEEEEAAKEEAYSECCEKYFRFDEEEDYSSVMKHKKECEYYVSISKEKKKKTRRNQSYVVLRTRMRKNKKETSFVSKMKMRRKRDKYDYQDYYVEPLIDY